MSRHLDKLHSSPGGGGWVAFIKFMEKKNYNAPAINMMRVQAEAVLAAASPEINISDVEATEDACSKDNDFDDDDYACWQ